jgi:hypothetical protein
MVALALRHTIRAGWLVAGLVVAACACSKSEPVADAPESRPDRTHHASAPSALTTSAPVGVEPSAPVPVAVEPPPAVQEVVAPSNPSAVSAPPSPPPGPSGKALLCNGQPDRDGVLPGVRLPVAGLFDDVQALTVELWFRPDTLADFGAPPEYILSAHREGDGRTDQNTDLSVSIRDGRTDRLAYFHVRQRDDGDCSSVGGSTASRQPLVPGRWVHLAASFERDADGSLATHTFLDGQRVSSNVTGSREEPCVAPLELTLCQGVTPSGIFTRPFIGAIDDVRVSRGVRYTDPFVPAPATADDQTLLLLRFDDGVIDDQGPNHVRASSIGSPEFVDTQAPGQMSAR